MGLGDDVRNALDDLATQLTLVPVPDADPPQRVRLFVSGPGATRQESTMQDGVVTNLIPRGIQPLSLVPATVPAPVDLAFVTKNVMFRTATLPLAPGPGTDLLAGLEGDITGGTGLGGVTSGAIGRIAGSFGVPVGQLVEQVGAALTVPVTLDVTVRVRDEAGSEMGGARIGFGTDALRSGSSTERRDVPAAAVPEIVVQVPVPFVELTTSAPPIVRATISVSVQLAATLPDGTAVRTGVVELPELPVAVPAIPVPVLAVFYSRPDFNTDSSGAPLPLSSAGSRDQQVQLYLFVPDSSPLPDPRDAIDALLAPLETLNRLLIALDLATAVLGAGGLGPITNALATVRNLAADADVRRVVCLVKDDEVPDWWQTFVTFGTFVGRDTAEDKIRSLALLAPPGRVLDLFEDDHFAGSAIRVQTRTPTTSDPRGLLTLVRRLDSRGAPPSDPPGQAIRLRGEEPMHQRISSSRWGTAAT